nr:MAG TPA: hypothetical protein [Caudoviricetes sp.]
MLRFVSSGWGSWVYASFVVRATLRFADYTCPRGTPPRPSCLLREG